MPRLVASSLSLIALIVCTSVLGAGGDVQIGTGGSFVIDKLEKVSDEERTRLRRAFRLSDSATITQVKNRPFDSGSRLKVCLETILDPIVGQDVTNWIAEWNQKEAKKYGALEIVPYSGQADVYVLRYLYALPPSDPISGATWTDPKGAVHRLIPVYSYLLVRKPDGLEILWRKVDLTYPEEHEFAAKLLVNELKKIMKDRNK